MRRIMGIWVVVIGGLILIVMGISTGGAAVYAQTTPDEADYVGARECGSCHRDLVRPHSDTPHALALQDVERDKDLILADFAQGEDVRTIEFPGESEPRAFTEDDVVYAIGAGRYAQRYLADLGDGEYVVLPVEWNTAAQSWQPLKLADTWPAPAYDWLQSCAGCHTTGLNVERGRWEDDGVQCEACHGPGSVHIETAEDAGRRPNEEELADIHAAIVLTPDAQVCGQCHSRGTEPENGRLYPVRYRPGSDLLHEDIFVLAAADDPVSWWGSGHGRQNNMQFNEWLASAHAGALETMKDSDQAQDGCLQCHSGDYALDQRLRALIDSGDRMGDPPPPLTLESARVGVTCITCHSPHHAQQANFLLVDEPNALCASCHQNTTLTAGIHHPSTEMFQGVTLIEAVEGIPSPHFADENGPRCVTCHMPAVPAGGFTLASHLLRPIVPGAADDSPPSACSKCHEDLTTADLQSLVQDTQSAIRSRLSTAWARVSSVAPPEAGTDAAALYEEVVAALTFVQNDGSQGVHNYAYADALLDATAGMLTQLSVPGASLRPTEAPAPTATPSQPQPVTVSAEVVVPTSIRPMTIIILAGAALILLIGAWVFFRQSRRSVRTRREA